MANCVPPRTPFVGTGRQAEGGFLATHKRDFLSHASGNDFRHCADQINMNPPLPGILGDDVQTALENMQLLIESGGASGEKLFVSVGKSSDGYAGGDYNVGLGGYATLTEAFTAAFSALQVSNGGIVVIKSGVYELLSTVEVPSGITIYGELGGVIINSQISSGVPMFRMQAADLSQKFTLGQDVLPAVDRITLQNSAKQNKLFNLTLVSNLTRTVGVGLSSTPMISIVNGANCQIEKVSCFGQSPSNSYNLDLCAVGSDSIVTGINTATEFTLLDINDCFFDNFSSIVNFRAPLGHGDSLKVRNCKMRFGGTNISSTEYRYAIASNLVDISITDNYCITRNGEDYDHQGFFYLRDEATNDSYDCKVNIRGNSGGGISYNTSLVLFNCDDWRTANEVDYDTFISGSIDKDNSWGSNFGTTSFYIVVGTGERGSIGDVNGRYALDFLLFRLDVSGLSSEDIVKVPKIYLLPGFYTITNYDDYEYLKMDIEGVITSFEQTYPKIYLQLDSSYTDEFDNKGLYITGKLKNLEITGDGLSSLIISYNYSDISKIEIENVVFRVPLTLESFSSITDSTEQIGTCGFLKNCNFLPNYDSEEEFVSPQVYLKIGTDFVFDNCYFSRVPRAIFVGEGVEYIDGKTLKLNKCKFELYENGSIEPVISSEPTSYPSDFIPQSYICVNELSGDHDNLIIQDCEFKLIGTSVEYSYSYQPFDQTLLDDNLSYGIYLKSKNITIDSCIGEGPQQAQDILVDGYGLVVPFFNLVFYNKCTIDNCIFRASLPLKINNEIYSQFNKDEVYAYPKVDILNTKLFNYSKDILLNSFGLLCIDLQDWELGSFRSNPASVNVNNCLFVQDGLVSGSDVNRSSLNENIVSTVFIRAIGWSVNFSNNNCNATHYNLYDSFSTVSIINHKDFISLSDQQNSSVIINNNNFSVYSSMNIDDDNGNNSIALYVNSNLSNINNNVFNFSGSSNSLYSLDGIVGFAIIDLDSDTQQKCYMTNNTFINFNDIPDWSVMFNTGSYGIAYFQNNRFPLKLKTDVYSNKFVGKTGTGNLYLNTVYNEGVASITGVDDTQGDWGKTVIYG